MIPDPASLRSVTITLTDRTHDMVNAVNLRLDLQFTDGLTATVVHSDVEEGRLGSVPDEMRDLADAFLWGDGVSAVIAWSQRWDRSQQARRVRRWLDER